MAPNNQRPAFFFRRRRPVTSICSDGLVPKKHSPRVSLGPPPEVSELLADAVNDHNGGLATAGGFVRFRRPLCRTQERKKEKKKVGSTGAVSVLRVLNEHYTEWAVVAVNGDASKKTD